MNVERYFIHFQSDFTSSFEIPCSLFMIQEGQGQEQTRISIPKRNGEADVEQHFAIADFGIKSGVVGKIISVAENKFA